jgi:hypothetical protein
MRPLGAGTTSAASVPYGFAGGDPASTGPGPLKRGSGHSFI